MAQKTNSLVMSDEQQVKKKKAIELRRQYETEILLIMQKYQKVLDEFALASEEMKRTLDEKWIPLLPNLNDELAEQYEQMRGEFVNKWNSLLSDYNNEVAKTTRRFKRLAKKL